MKKLIGLVLVSVLLVWPIVATAATFKAGDSYSLARGQTMADDLYVASGTITVSGVVSGDLVAAGGNLSVTGDVAEDAILAGGTINLGGSVGDDARVAGGNVSIDGTIADDLFVAGGQVHLTSSSVVSGDLVVAGGQVIVDGRVNGNVNITSGQVTLGDTAVVAGNLSYKSKKEAAIASGARIAGTTTFNQIQRFDRQQSFGLLLVFSFFAKLLLAIVTAILLVLIFKTKAPRVVHQGINNFWPSLLRGFLVMIVVPVAIILVGFTVVGIPIAILALFGYIAWMILSAVGSGILFGSWLAKVAMKRDPAPVNWKTALLGTIALFVVYLVPFAGWIVGFAFFLVTLGAIAKQWYDSAWLNR